MASTPFAGEIDLLFTSLSANRTLTTDIRVENLNVFVNFIANGDYSLVLQHHCVPNLLLGCSSPFDNSFSSEPSLFYDKIQQNVQNLWVQKLANDDQTSSATSANFDLESLLPIGISCLYLFLQGNMTGPEQGTLSSPAEAMGFFQQDSESGRHSSLGLWDDWARKELMIDGSDSLGKYKLPQFLLLARILLLPPWKSLQSLLSSSNSLSQPRLLLTQPWWGVRVLLTHQRILSEHSPSLRKLLVALTKVNLSTFGSATALEQSDWVKDFHPEGTKPISQILAAEALVEAGLMELAYGHSQEARTYFKAAAATCGLDMEVTGAAGFRTKYQVEPKAQMVLALTSHLSGDPGNYVSDEDGCDEGHAASAAAPTPVSEVLSGESDILLNPNLVQEDAAPETGPQGEEITHSEGSGAAQLSSIEQAIVLCHALEVRRNNPDDELRTWQMAPYIEAVGSQRKLRPMLKAWSDLLRVRWERSRGRTRERALFLMDQLVTRIRDGAASSPLNRLLQSRMRYVFSVWLPTWPALQKEYGELLVANGMVGEALSVFERLELWDSLIDLYKLLGKSPKAMALVKERLQESPEDPRLWCSLGDLTLEDAPYLKAWEVSGCRYARAKRSLARLAMNREDYEQSVAHWRTALSLNPLHPDGWFSMGYAAIKAGDSETALLALTRSVQLDPDNGEAWNNVAVLYLKKGDSPRAFTALQQALKFKRDNWQMWANFTQVALDVRSFSQAVRAVKSVLDLTNGKQTDVPAIGQLVDEVEVGRGLRPAPPAPALPASAVLEDIDSEVFDGLEPLVLSSASPAHVESDASPAALEGEESAVSASLRQRDWMEKEVRVLIGRVASSGNGGAEIWRHQWRFFQAVGEGSMAHEALVKLVRSLQGSDWPHSLEKFVAYSEASLKLCESYLELARKAAEDGDAAGGKKLAASARMHLKNVLKQGDAFRETEQFTKLEQCLERVLLLTEGL